jgi:hypothetical protein
MTSSKETGRLCLIHKVLEGPLGEGTDESKVHARFENGVLEVTVEGAGAVEEPKRIQIEGSGS